MQTYTNTHSHTKLKQERTRTRTTTIITSLITYYWNKCQRTTKKKNIERDV